jgi:hypothetical protein
MCTSIATVLVFELLHIIFLDVPAILYMFYIASRGIIYWQVNIFERRYSYIHLYRLMYTYVQGSRGWHLGDKETFENDTGQRSWVWVGEEGGGGQCVTDTPPMGKHTFRPQSRQSAKLFLQSSELGLPQPLTPRRVCEFWGEGHIRWRERG